MGSRRGRRSWDRKKNLCEVFPLICHVARQVRLDAVSSSPRLQLLGNISRPLCHSDLGEPGHRGDPSTDSNSGEPLAAGWASRKQDHVL